MSKRELQEIKIQLIQDILLISYIEAEKIVLLSEGMSYLKYLYISSKRAREREFKENRRKSYIEFLEDYNKQFRLDKDPIIPKS